MNLRNAMAASLLAGLSITGFAGVDDPTEYAAISMPGWESMSWVEVIGRLRTSAVNLGTFTTNLTGWGIFRFSGYEYNFAVPGFTAGQFEQVVNSSLFTNPQLFPYRQQLAGVLQSSADAAVVWLGSNEIRANYGFLYDGNDPTPLVTELRNDLGAVLDFVQAQKPGIKLVVVNLPDLGATPDKQAAHPDPLKRANVTAATVLANQAITNLAAARAIPVADAFTDTYRLITGETVWIGPVNLYPGSHPDNHPRYQFTRDGLHPNTCLQAIIANTIIDTFNRTYATGIARLANSEILNLTALNPLQPFLDWANTNSLAVAVPGGDPDGDRLVNLAEFVFATNPSAPNPGPVTIDRAVSPWVVRFHPDKDRQRLGEVRTEWANDLESWGAIPATSVATAPNGEVTVTLPAAGPARFVRLRIAVRPVD